MCQNKLSPFGSIDFFAVNPDPVSNVEKSYLKQYDHNDTLFCVNCGEELKEHAKFCGKCGSTIDSSKSQISPKISDYDPHLKKPSSDARPKRKLGLIISGILILSLGSLTSSIFLQMLLPFPEGLYASFTSYVILAVPGGILIVKGAKRK